MYFVNLITDHVVSTSDNSSGNRDKIFTVLILSLCVINGFQCVDFSPSSSGLGSKGPKIKILRKR